MKTNKLNVYSEKNLSVVRENTSVPEENEKPPPSVQPGEIVTNHNGVVTLMPPQWVPESQPENDASSDESDDDIEGSDAVNSEEESDVEAVGEVKPEDKIQHVGKYKSPPG